MRAKGAKSFADYAGVLDTDPIEYDKLVETLTINVSKFFRNPETFACIATKVLPELWAGRSPILRMWSAGCATGEEPYSLAVLCREHALANNDLRGLDRVRIIGSDVDREAVSAASKGRYPAASFGDTPPAVVEKYFPLEHGLHSVIYFTRETQERLFDRFHELLLPGGFLVLGKVETLLGKSRESFAPVSSRERVYRRL
jgi:chemotaxis protein methyltransferase CheR